MGPAQGGRRRPGRPRPAPTGSTPTSLARLVERHPGGGPPAAGRPRLAGPGPARAWPPDDRPLRRGHPPGRPRRAGRGGAGVRRRRRADGCEAAGYCDTNGLGRRPSPTPPASGWRAGRARADRRGHPPHRRRPTAGAGRRSSRLADIDGGRRRPRRRPSKARRGRRPGRHRARRATRWCWSRPAWPTCWSSSLRRVQRQDLRRGPVVRGAGRAAVRPGRSPSGTTPPTPGPSAVASTPRARPSAGSTWCGEGVHRRPCATTGGRPAEAGTESTGHAVAAARAGRPSPPTCSWRRATRRPRSWSPRVERGLLVTELLVHPHPRPQDPGGHRPDPQRHLPDRGRRGRRRRCATCASPSPTSRPWRPGNVLGVGDDARLFGGSYHVPSLRLASWNFTGGASG